MQAPLGTRALPRLASPVAAVAGLALLAAFAAGSLLATDVPAGVALVVALVYAPVALVSLPIGLALWMSMIMVEQLPVAGVAPSAAGILLVLAWIGTMRGRRAAARAVLRRHRQLLLAIAAFLVWLAVSLLWARQPGLGGGYLVNWLLSALLFLIVATAVATPRHVRLLAAGLVAGAVLSAAAGLTLDTGDRVSGGAADPNFLAAALVPAIALAAGLLATTAAWHARWALAGSIAVMAAALAATGSRGGIFAGAAAAAAALAMQRRGRGRIVVLVAVVGCVWAAWFAANPAAWERVTSFEDEGNGRADLWLIALREAADHPFGGVGLDNFEVEAPRYVLEPGALNFAELIVERPQEVHNTYLELLVETGPIGALLFIGIVVTCLRAMQMAAARFEVAGERELAMLARAVLVAAIGSLAALFFLSNGPDKVTWTLLALGPALLGIAVRHARAAPAMRP